MFDMFKPYAIAPDWLGISTYRLIGRSKKKGAAAAAAPHRADE